MSFEINEGRKRKYKTDEEVTAQIVRIAHKLQTRSLPNHEKGAGNYLVRYGDADEMGSEGYVATTVEHVTDDAGTYTENYLETKVDTNNLEDGFRINEMVRIDYFADAVELSHMKDAGYPGEYSANVGVDVYADTEGRFTVKIQRRDYYKGVIIEDVLDKNTQISLAAKALAFVRSATSHVEAYDRNSA